jgi:hypothetical protein
LGTRRAIAIGLRANIRARLLPSPFACVRLELPDRCQWARPMGRKGSNTRRMRLGHSRLRAGWKGARIYEGRHFETLSVGDLRSEWISAIDRCSVSLTAAEARRLADDLQAEMEVRKIAPPFDEAKEKPRARGAGRGQSFEDLRRIKREEKAPHAVVPSAAGLPCLQSALGAFR